MIKQVIENLPKTMEYCNHRILNHHESDSNILRSIITEINGKSIYSGDDKIQDWKIDYLNDNQWLHDIFQQQLASKKLIQIKKAKGLNGKLISFNYNETLICGGSQASSNGFIDNYNFPPIDTWVWLGTFKKDDLLIAWIPNKFIQLAQAGIDANPEGCINWLSEWYPEINEEIILSFEDIRS